jgi:DNA primase
MGNVNDWLSKGFSPPSQHQSYLRSRGVHEKTSLEFFSWTPPDSGSPCPKFASHFGALGLRLKEHLIIPVRSPRGNILGFEARLIEADGSKKVNQYRTAQAEWNPYFLGAEKAFEALWQGADIWIVEGAFDMVALERVVPSCDAVISTLRAGMDVLSIEMISRFYTAHSTIHICYDNDETGRNKATSLYHTLKKQGLRVTLPKYRGKDPNEVWKAGGDSLLRRYFL